MLMVEIGSRGFGYKVVGSVQDVRGCIGIGNSFAIK